MIFERDLEEGVGQTRETCVRKDTLDGEHHLETKEQGRKDISVWREAGVRERDRGEAKDLNAPTAAGGGVSGDTCP